VKKTIMQMLKLDHQGQVITLAMMIAGIVMSSEVPSKTKDQSVEMRMRRWVKADLDVEVIYMPFARQILETLLHTPLVLGCMSLFSFGLMRFSLPAIISQMFGDPADLV